MRSGTFETEWTLDRVRETTEVNRIRERVEAWRIGGYVSITSTTRRLLDYWNDPDRTRRLFFCQREAVETAIYLTEVAAKYGDAWIQNALSEWNAQYNAGPAARCSEDGDGQRQDRGDGDAHRLAGPQQA